MLILLIPLAFGVSALLVVAYLVMLIDRESSGTPKMEQIASHIRVGMRAYLWRQTITIMSFIPLLAALIWVFLSWKTAVAFVFGTFLPLLTGYNVEDCASRGSDLFQSFSDDIVTGMLIGLAYTGRYGENAIIFPFLLQASGIFASIVGIYSVKAWRRMSPSRFLTLGFFITVLISAFSSYLLSVLLLNDLAIFLAALSGILAMTLAVFVVRYYTGMGLGPVGKIVEASRGGAAINIITGMAYGLQSSIVPILGVIAAIIFSFVISGYSLYAIVVANIGTDLMIRFIMSSDAFGPIMDNANGIIEMSGISEEVGDSMSMLDAVGNSMKAQPRLMRCPPGR